MEKDFQKTVFYRSFMTCVFAGLTGTVLSMLYDLAFVQIAKFPLSSIINVSTLIFAINIAFMLIGLLYYALIKYARWGQQIFCSLLLLLTLWLLFAIQHFQRTGIASINVQFRWLSSGIVVMLGLIASFGVPFLYRNKKFGEYII